MSSDNQKMVKALYADYVVEICKAQMPLKGEDISELNWYLARASHLNDDFYTAFVEYRNCIGMLAATNSTEDLFELLQD